MIRLIAMLACYRESPTWLAATVASLTKANISHVIVCDGAFRLFPGANAEVVSGAEQADAIVQTAHGAGIGCTIHRPNRPWAGNEVEMRSFMFSLALLEAEPHLDWLLWIDADEVIHQAPTDLLDRLAASEHDCAAVSLWQRQDPHATVRKSEVSRRMEFGDWTNDGHRVLYRALPGLHCEGEHHIVTDGTKYLRGDTGLAPFEDCNDMVIEHRHEFRDMARNRLSREYQQRQARLNIERPTVSAKLGEAFSWGFQESVRA